MANDAFISSQIQAWAQVHRHIKDPPAMRWLAERHRIVRAKIRTVCQCPDHRDAGLVHEIVANGLDGLAEARS